MISFSLLNRFVSWVGKRLTYQMKINVCNVKKFGTNLFLEASAGCFDVVISRSFKSIFAHKIHKYEGN